MHYRCFQRRFTGPLLDEVARIGGGAKLLIAALSVLALSACAAAARKTFRCPDQGGTTWTRVISDHFVLLTDQDRQAAEATSSELELMLWALSDHAFRSPNRPKMTVEVVAFKDGDEYETIASGMTAGVFIPGGLRDFERRPLALVKGDLRQSRATFQHELTHFLVHYYLPQAPMWLNEGLAQFYETLTLEDGEIKIGMPTTAMNTWSPDDYDPESLLSPRMSIERAPSIAALLAMDPIEFYGETEAESDSGVIQTLQRAAVHYVCAWNLVHLFLTDEKYRREFGSYLVALSSGEENDFAWDRTLGSLDREKLEAD